ncbi:hypothetical protein [Streptomyces sp. NPDC014685]|uniref:hypothetical protein n=1 Tax=Streptomyces sp. NPDC014685 TaxID=3364881 RepID=UPI0036F9F427
MAEHQHPHGQRIGPLRGDGVQGPRGQEAGTVRNVPFRGCRADLAHVDTDPAQRVLCGGPVRVDVYVDSGAERSVRMVDTADGRRVDAKSGHGAIKHLGLLMRQVRRGEEGAGL